MTTENDSEKKNAGAETITVIPDDSPSENYLVSEHLARMPSLFARGLIYIIIAAVLTAVVYSVLARIDIVAQCTGIARPASRTFKVVSDRDAYMEGIFVKDGSKVAEDDPLFLLRSREALNHSSRIDELASSIPLKERYYDAKIAAVDANLQQLKQEHQSTMDILQLRLEKNDISIDSIDSDMDYWKKEQENLGDEFENTRKLFEKQLTSIAEYNNIKSRLERAKTEVEKLSAQRRITLQESAIIKSEMQREKQSFVNKQNVLLKDRSALEIERSTSVTNMTSELATSRRMLSIHDIDADQAEAEAQGGKMIRAERSGVVSELLYSVPDEYVTEGTQLCVIVPTDDPLYMEITVPNKDAGFIEPGMKIKYKFDAYPFADYGTLSGKVVGVSASAVMKPDIGFVYIVRGSIDKPSYTIRGKAYPLRPGMTALAEIVTERRSILSLIFRKIRK